MRWLKQQDRDDSGVVTLFVIGMIPVLLLATAAGVDVNRFSQENSSAQHSADATALAVATDCALSGSPQGAALYDQYRKLEQVVSAGTPITCGSNEVRITIEKNVNGGLVLDRNARVVHKTATVKWGALAGATTVPITVAKCEFEKFEIDPNSEIIVHLPDTKNGTGCDSNPGGFGQLDDDGSDTDPCTTKVTAGGVVGGDPGNDFIQLIRDGCVSPLPADLLIPVYDETLCVDNDCQGNGEYPIDGFAVFRLTGYSFFPRSEGTLVNGDCDTSIGKNCIKGYFLDRVTSYGTPGGDPSKDYGLTVVYLYS